jgi:hypothetical protein
MVTFLSRILEAEIDWVVCLGVGYVMAACAQLGSCALCHRLREATRREGASWFGRYLTGCLGQALLASLPRLVDEGSGPTPVIRSYVDFRDRAS